MPNGTYKVSDTLIYRGATVGAYPKWDGTFDINHVHFVGQDRAKTVIKLADHCAGYQDPAHPKIVLAFQHPDTVFNNVPGGNWLRNLTVDTGRGNPGAVGLFFQGANNTDLRGVTVRSGDGAGRYGIWFKQGSIQGYYADVTVQGFQDGICDAVNAEGDVAFEYLTLRGQTEAGFLLTGGGASLRRVRSEQAAGVPALKVDGSGPQAVILDSELKGAGPSGPAIEMTRASEQCLFARDVATAGYAAAVRKAGADAVPAPFVDEYVSSPVKTLAAGSAPGPCGCPSWTRRPSHGTILKRSGPSWTITPASRRHLIWARPVVCFKQRHYKLTGDVMVPASVHVVNGLAAEVKGDTFIVTQPSPLPVLFQDSNMPIRVTAQRDIIQRCASGGLSNPNGLPVTFFLENVNDDATGDDFCPPSAHVFARQIDIEYGGNNQTNRPPPDQQHPILFNDGGRASATLFTNLGDPCVKAVVETRGGVTTTAPNTDFPLRGSVYRSDYVIPLYVGDTRPSNAPR